MVSVNQSSFDSNLAEGGNGSVDFYQDPVTGGDGGSASGGGICQEGGTLEVRQSTITGNEAFGGLGGSGGGFIGLPGYGAAGGLFLQGADLDTFTVDHTITNNPDDIVGYYHLTGPPRLAIGDVTVLEGNTGTTNVIFTVSLSAASDQPVTVAYATADGTATAGSDYVAASGTLTIPAGQMTGTITVPVNGDRLAEPNETFVVNLSSPTGATIADGQGVGTIVDDEPRISITPSVSRSEGNTGQAPLAFAVTLSSAYDAPVTVAWGTADKTATAGGDYQAASGTLTFAPGETSKTISVLVNGDRLAEPNETFVVNLSSPTNATVAAGQGVGTIVDDEPRISIGDMSKKEGNSGLTTFAFTVSLSVAYDVPVTVAYATANGTATAGGDYRAATGTLTIPAGQTSGTITVQVIGDRLAEPNETFFVNLGNPNYGVITRGQGVGTILDDEPRISIGDVTKSEGKKQQTTLFTFTVTLSAAYDQPVTMSFRTVDGTATTSDGDYVAQTGTLTFAPGETSKTITIVVQGDSKRESDETFYLDLFGNSSNSLFTKKSRPRHDPERRLSEATAAGEVPVPRIPRRRSGVSPVRFRGTHCPKKGHVTMNSINKRLCIPIVATLVLVGAVPLMPPTRSRTGTRSCRRRWRRPTPSSRTARRRSCSSPSSRRSTRSSGITSPISGPSPRRPGPRRTPRPSPPPIARWWPCTRAAPRPTTPCGTPRSRRSRTARPRRPASRSGEAAADAMLALRANDGSGAIVPYTPGNNPGDWQPTPPASRRRCCPAGAR